MTIQLPVIVKEDVLQMDALFLAMDRMTVSGHLIVTAVKIILLDFWEKY